MKEWLIKEESREKVQARNIEWLKASDTFERNDEFGI